MKRRLLTALFSLYVFCVSIPAQNSTALPKLLPSYSEDFSDYNSFPSICIASTFYDQQGKLWLVPCRSVNRQASLHLLQFDGYEFRFIRGSLDQLPNDCDILGLYQSSEIVLVPIRTDSNQLFFYDLETAKMRVHKLDQMGTLIFGVLTENQRILLFFQQEKDFIITEWKEDKLEELGKVTPPDTDSKSVLVVKFSEEEVWFRTTQENGSSRLLRYDIKNDAVKNYDRTVFEPDGTNDDSPFFLNSVTTLSFSNLHKETTYFFKENPDRSRTLYQFDKAIDTFKLVEGLPIMVSDYSRVFQDDLGNTLFLIADEQANYQAILQDTKGNRFDYSAFFMDLRGTAVTSTLSPNFKERVVLSTSRGIVMKEVINTSGIQHFLKGTSIRAMIELPNRQVMISSHDRGTYLLDLNSNTVENFIVPGCPFETETFRLFYAYDSEGRIVTAKDKSFVKYDPRTGACTYFPTTSPKVNHFVMINNDQAAFLLPDEPINLYRFSTQETTPLLDQGKPLKVSGSINGLHYDPKKEILWVATSTGLWKINLADQKMEILGKETGFLDHRFLGMAADQRGRLWLGTPLGGLHIYDPETKEVKVLNSEGGLANNTVASIVEDDDGDWWLGTYNGISLVTREGELIANFGLKDGLVERENNRFARLKTKDGRLLIGTINGLNLIDPKVLKQRTKQTKNLKIYLNSIEFFDQQRKGKIKRTNDLTDLETLQLPASKRFLNLSFSLSSYFKPKENRFAYQLEGIDEDWNYLGTQPSLSLSNLPAGEYRLLIKGSDATGKWTEQPIAISIQAREFFYKRPRFYLLLGALLIIGALTWIRRLRTEVKKATHKIRQQAEQLKDLDKAKSVFFTNISHEFRTPLTVISGLASRLRNHPEDRKERSFKMIQRSSDNLLNLVNQILDLRKLESGKLKLNLVQADVIPYLRYIIESFESLAQSRDIELSMTTTLDSLVLDHDKKKLLRIVSNLLSNALKFTPPGGKIEVVVGRQGTGDRGQGRGAGSEGRSGVFRRQDEEAGVRGQERGAGSEKQWNSETMKQGQRSHLAPHPSFLFIQIEDTGIGIPPEKLPKIFDRFYQTDSISTRIGEGTGIGLALCQELTVLLGGKITVESNVNEGTLFTVQLPITNNAPTTEEAPQAFVLSDEPGLAPLGPNLLPNLKAEIHTGAELPLILLVEDNADVMQYLITCLEGSFNLLTASDGQEGIEKAIETVPDAIISDVMMPRKDGFELCYTLKTDERTSHVPIILLTAKADVDSRLSGLRRGADDYLTKPFNEEELLTRLNNQIEIRRRLQHYFQQYAQTLPGEASEEVKQEHEFLTKIKNLLDENLDDEKYGIAEICREIGASRTQLHRKIKALTGQSTSIYIRRFRLHRAKAFLETRDLNVSQAAYEVGFTSHSYFSKLFSEEFGISPSEISRR